MRSTGLEYIWHKGLYTLSLGLRILLLLMGHHWKLLNRGRISALKQPLCYSAKERSTEGMERVEVEIWVKKLLQTLLHREIPNNVCRSSALKEVEFSWLSQNVSYEWWLPELEHIKAEKMKKFAIKKLTNYLNKVIKANIGNENSW